MKVKIKKVRENAVLPELGSTGAAGFDLRVVAFLDKDGNELGYDRITLSADHTVIIKCATGLSMEIPEGYCLKILPRSGLAFKEGITVINSPGLIDSDYRGEIIVGLIRHHSIATYHDSYIYVGDRIAQGLFEKVEIPEFELVDDLSDTERGTGGFGSTGNN